MFGWQIRDLRKRLGLSQAAFARRIGADAGTVSRWERGTNAPGGLSRKVLEGVWKEVDDGTADSG